MFVFPKCVRIRGFHVKRVRQEKQGVNMSRRFEEWFEKNKGVPKGRGSSVRSVGKGWGDRQLISGRFIGCRRGPRVEVYSSWMRSQRLGGRIICVVKFQNNNKDCTPRKEAGRAPVDESLQQHVRFGWTQARVKSNSLQLNCLRGARRFRRKRIDFFWGWIPNCSKYSPRNVQNLRRAVCIGSFVGCEVFWRGLIFRAKKMLKIFLKKNTAMGRLWL